ncbi:MAG TPA: (d)CMP kinase [Planctomycetota bacterium]|nr:(d)CMP kinase [Planctomycetota bacterium]
MDEHIIAIDGPAGSGKSTAARHLAEAIGFSYLNSGAMYRAVAFLADEGGIDLEDPAKVAEIAESMRFEYRLGPDGKQRFWVNGADRTDSLFTAALTGKLKPVVNNTRVREELVKKMRLAVRKFLDSGASGVVMEGRDIGTVVFPDAPMKFYIHASLDARTDRRAAELKARGEKVDRDGLRKQIEYRDATDKAREVGALIQHDDAIDVDTTNLDEAATLKLLVEKVRAHWPN